MSVLDLSLKLEKDRSLDCMSLCKSDPLCGGIFLKVNISNMQYDDGDGEDHYRAATHSVTWPQYPPWNWMISKKTQDTPPTGLSLW